MRFEVSKEEIKKANVPHELFLTNLIGNRKERVIYEKAT
jgi:hypothetical protein